MKGGTIGFGIAIGCGLALLIGRAVDNWGLGIAVGIVLGMVLAVLAERIRRTASNRRNRKELP